jgi:hypothetical protein
MTNGTDNQILAAYKQGLSPEQIAEDLGFPVYAVKAKLMSLSSEYRKSCGKEGEEEDELNFSREEQLMIKRELLGLAMSTEDEHLKGKLLLNLRDDGKGRKDIVKSTQQAIGTMNILQLVNGSIQQARAGAREIKAVVERKTIKA